MTFAWTAAFPLLVGSALFVKATYAQPCSIDICFAIDESGSLGNGRYDMELRLVTEIVDAIDAKKPTDPAAPPSRYTGFTYDEDSSKANKVSDLTANHQLFKIRVNNLSSVYDGGYTNVYEGIENCFAALTNPSRSRVVVLLTDGVPNRGPGAPDMDEMKANVLAIADEAKATGVSIFAVGLYAGTPSALDQTLLREVSSGPGDSITVSFSDMDSLVPTLANDYCGARVQSPPSKRGSPSAPAPPVVCACNKVTRSEPGRCLDFISTGRCRARQCHPEGYVCDLGGTMKCFLKSAPGWTCTSGLVDELCSCHQEFIDVVALA